MKARASPPATPERSDGGQVVEIKKTRKDNMSKTSLVIIGAVLAVLIATGAAVFAAEGNKPKMLESAVEKGLISQEQADNLKTYGKEFHQERMKEMMENRINKAVTDGTITEDEAKQIRDWFGAKPAAMQKIGPMRGGHKGMGF